MQQCKFKLLAVDDHINTLRVLELKLGTKVDFRGVTNAEEALDLLQTQSFDIVMTDYDLGSETNGLQIFKEARRRNPHVTACLMSGNDAAPIMQEFLEAFGGIFLSKPLADEDLDRVFTKAQRNRDQLRELNPTFSGNELMNGFIAETPSMQKLLQTAIKVAPMVTISPHMTGPTGTGKSTIAQIIHDLSGVKGKLITVNCSTLEELAMSRLFGWTKGAFTGSVGEHVGFIAKADGGTLFLDELHLLPKDVQGKLLRVSQEGKYQRLGEEHERESKFRLITAASVDVYKLSKEEKFLPDLWYRISGKTLNVPALAERKACIPRIVYQQLNQFALETKNTYELDNDAMDLLVSFSWEGNIRDLTNALRSLCSDTNSSGRISAEMVKEELTKRAGFFPTDQKMRSNGETLDAALRSYEITCINSALKANNFVISHAARSLGMPRSTLRNRMGTLGMRV